MSVIEGPRTPVAIGLRVAIVVLTLATAYIHYTLGSMMFVFNAAGYVVLAAAMVTPLPIFARYRWWIRGALLGWTVVTILGWVMFGARFDLAYFSKAIEVVLIVLLVVEMFMYDGGPINVVRKGIAWLISIARYPFNRGTQA
ncbi:MAG: hypothetical protein WD830_04290 [Chloroflexota bacterium]